MSDLLGGTEPPHLLPGNKVLPRLNGILESVTPLSETPIPLTKSPKISSFILSLPRGRLHCSGTDCVNPHALLDVLDGERLGEAYDGGLGGPVGEPGLGAHDARDHARHVDD